MLSKNRSKLAKSQTRKLFNAGLPSMADILIEKGLQWLGHVHRMNKKHLPRQLLYSHPCGGKKIMVDHDCDSKMLLSETWSGEINTEKWQAAAEIRVASSPVPQA